MAEMDIQQLLKFLPQRYPVLMLDRVRECDPGKRIVALKNVSANEPYFQGHFPGRPIMPGVMILEAMAQAAGVLAFSAEDKNTQDHLYYYVGIDNARFKKPVEPGDQLVLNATLERSKAGMVKFAANATVGDSVVVSADLMCTMRRLD